MTTHQSKRFGHLRKFALLAIVALIGCETGVVSPTATPGPRGDVSSQAVAQGEINWLPALGTGVADPTTFDAAAVTRVEVCLWVSGACSGLPVAQFAITPAAGESPLTANTTVGRYEASWNLLNAKFTTRRTYRIRALQGTTEVGGILVDVVRGRWALTLAGGAFAPLVAANNLDIQFHVARALPPTIAINEVESSGGTPGDWTELYNTGTSPVDISGFIFKDNDDTHSYTIPANTVVAPGAYYMLEEAAFGFGLGSADAARLFDKSLKLVDSYSWTAHAATTYGRCPNGTGAFTTSVASTKAALNNCGTVVVPPTPPANEVWPGTDNVMTVDGVSVFGGNLSGLVYEAGAAAGADVLWGARNGPGSIFRLIFNGSIWTPDPTNGWSAGKLLRYTDGTGEPDTEDITFTTGSAAGMYIVSERNNTANGVSRPSVLRYDVSGTTTTLTATNEWVLTADLPVVAANSGLEGITFVPDSYLVAQGFFDVTANHLYNPAEYPNHAGGLFFVGLEGNGFIYVYALNHVTNAFSRIASLSTGFPSGVMSLQFDRELGQLWAGCDDTCGGLFNIYVIDVTPASPTLGRLKLTHVFNRPSTMPNINNEGFAFAPQAACVAGFKPAFWSDDSETGGHSIRKASIPCVKFP